MEMNFNKDRPMNITLTPKMKRGIEYLMAHPSATQQEIADFVGCSIATVRKWKYHPLYTEEFEKRLEEEWRDYRLSAQKKMKELADNGDYRAVAYILDSNGYSAPQQIEVNSNVITVSLLDEGE